MGVIRGVDVSFFLTGPTGGIARGYLHDFGILPGARTRDASPQSPWRIASPPDRPSLYGRARGHLHRVSQVPCNDYCSRLGAHLSHTPPFEQQNYKEAEVYLLRFQQCTTRAMTLIKMYFVGFLRALTQVSQQLFDQVFLTAMNLSDPTFLKCLSIYIYRRFPTPHKCIFFTRVSSR